MAHVLHVQWPISTLFIRYTRGPHMTKLLELARDALANAVALARMVQTTKPADELAQSAKHVETEATEIVQAIDDLQD